MARAGVVVFILFVGSPLTEPRCTCKWLRAAPDVRPDFPDRHAWQVVRTLSQHAEELASAAPASPAASPVPVHAGALAYAAGEPLPPPEAAQDAGMPHDHVH